MGFYKISKVVMRSLFQKPATRLYPAVPREWQERTRGYIGIEEAGCILCGICVKKCPTKAIATSREERTWVIERMRCIQCNSCVEVCPKKCLHMHPAYTAPDTEKKIDSFSIPEQPKPAPKPKPEAAPEASQKETAVAEQL